MARIPLTVATAGGVLAPYEIEVHILVEGGCAEVVHRVVNFGREHLSSAENAKCCQTESG
jgi:hypothetical protein